MTHFFCGPISGGHNSGTVLISRGLIILSVDLYCIVTYICLISAIISSQTELCEPLIETINDVFPNSDLSIMRVLYLTSYDVQYLRSALITAKDHARSK